MTQTDDPKLLMRSIIQRIATGPELSKDISLDEARAGMRAILDNAVDPVQAGIFLIALRMKRETDDEMKGVLDAIREATGHVVAGVDEVVDIADPYDGYNRCLPAAPFLMPVLAECSVTSISHGAHAVGPKFGVTHRHVLEAAGAPVDLTPVEAAERLADPELGWSYVDQRAFCAPLHHLVDLRSTIVKRQVITTTEVLARPIHGRRHTHLVTGYVHKPYPRIYAMLARHAGFDSALLIRGVEGGVIPSLRQQGVCFSYQHHSEEQSFEIDPTALGIEQTVRSVPLPEDLPQTTRPGDEIAVAVDVEATAQAAAEAGLAALDGAKGPTYDSLVCTGALILWHLGRARSLEVAADRVRDVLDSGRAARRVR
ncbi:anthranilate phosphoribosyltransferase [Allochromatium vinosum]|uniref:Glycosyl transferase, family 3-like protein n=1 Tax=Allochromatium vinosum (strain ATCC 17899 / DSM 180 / NBRC 103801 / NCIMB 10441 / D) TaxID=572477 RepID=D3RPQ7_ALLVD|nr:anthranilate phosphoribosyltransferase [Allochromatium vinosum]ADC61639.1 Glycosyl transferase, family 3-like protein [Allochromatium vinosum DSM 180]